MRSTLLLILSLALATPVLAKPPQAHTPQTRPPSRTKPAAPRAACYELHSVKVSGATQCWARVEVGDEWISGCVGSEAECYAPVWVVC